MVCVNPVGQPQRFDRSYDGDVLFMKRSTPLNARRSAVAAVLSALLFAACGSAPVDEPAEQDPTDIGTIEPLDENGVGGGLANDDLGGAQREDDVDGDGQPG